MPEETLMMRMYTTINKYLNSFSISGCNEMLLQHI